MSIVDTLTDAQVEYMKYGVLYIKDDLEFMLRCEGNLVPGDRLVRLQLLNGLIRKCDKLFDCFPQGVGN